MMSGSRSLILIYAASSGDVRDEAIEKCIAEPNLDRDEDFRVEELRPSTS